MDSNTEKLNVKTVVKKRKENESGKLSEFKVVYMLHSVIRSVQMVNGKILQFLNAIFIH